MKQLIIVTGMSGAGKSTVIEALEDIGVYCIDNLPPLLVPKLTEVMEAKESSLNRVALGIDLRGREMFNRMIDEIAILEKDNNLTLEVIYLDATDETLVARFKETRRTHPIDDDLTLLEAIHLERTLLSELKSWTTEIIDTSDLKPKELRQRIFNQFSKNPKKEFQVYVKSFGFKHGAPIDADLMFDVRFLPNPHYISELRPYTGLDKPVADYVLKFKESHEFYDKLYSLIHYMLPKFQEEGKSQLVIAIGCTGGQHRSVTFVEKLSKDLQNNFEYQVRAVHRDAEIEGTIR